MSKANNLTDFLTGVANAIRTKKGTTDPINAQNYEDEILSIAGGGATLNIHYGMQAPTDTSKLWIKLANAPTKVEITNKLNGGNETLDSGIASLPTTVVYASSINVGTKIYLFGGKVSISGDILNTIIIFDTETNNVEVLNTTLPTGLYQTAITNVGTKIYLFGGNTGAGGTNSIMVFDTETNTIETLSTTLPSSSYSMGCERIGTKIYLFGGYGTSAKNSIMVFNTETNIIETLSTTLKTIRNAFACSKIGAKIYLFGGSTGTGSINSIEIFDTETYTSETLSTTLPKATQGLTCSNIGTKIYLFGGNATTTSIMVFDTETNTIETLSTTLPTNLTYSTSTNVGTKIYLFGGGSTPSASINRFNTQFDVDNGTLQLLNQNIPNKLPIINDEHLKVEIGVGMALLGNSANIGEEVEYGIYNNGEWVGNITIEPETPEEPDTPEVITDLTGKTIGFNDSLTNSEDKTYAVNFTTGNNETYTELRIIAGQNIEYANGDNVGPVYVNGVWVDDPYKTIQVTGGIDATNTELISKIQQIATITHSTGGSN